METIHTPTTEHPSASGRRPNNEATENMEELRAVAANEIKSLIADVEELVARIADLNDADVVRMRTKVMRAVDSAKEGLADGADTLRRQASKAMSGADEYVRESPWVAVGLAALVGAVVGILVARRS
ncbi:MAG: YqjD family protein [Steroidobacteraceae bacterium]